MPAATVVGIGLAAAALAATARAAGLTVVGPIDPSTAASDVAPSSTTRVLLAPDGVTREQLVELALAFTSRRIPVWLDVTTSPELGNLLPCERLGDRLGVVLMRHADSPLRRMIDAAIASVALVALSPLLLVLAFLTKVSSPGPVFHRAVVVGQDGRPFTWYKFRTMRVAGEDEPLRRRRFAEFVAGGAAPAKIVDDARVTTTGRVLRRHSLDELPQLLSVLKGDMTLVGPRPCLVYEYELLRAWHRQRFAARPGLTGLWQVCGRGRVHADEMAFMDIVYSLGRTWWSDVRV
ncbi:MAG TPA: sugar transferase, partial [Candidatus Kryptonia bacterium]|nr:sugar transferase [Candidatus Kryptonia bacterium]